MTLQCSKTACKINTRIVDRIACVSVVLQAYTLTGNHIHTSVHSLQSNGVLASSWFAVSHQEAGFPAALQLSVSLLPSHTAMVPAWRGRRRAGKKDWRGSRSVTYSTVTYGDKSNVKPVIGDDELEREREKKAQSKELLKRCSDSELMEKWVNLEQVWYIFAAIDVLPPYLVN